MCCSQGNEAAEKTAQRQNIEGNVDGDYTKPSEVDRAWCAYIMRAGHCWSTWYFKMRRPVATVAQPSNKPSSSYKDQTTFSIY